ncbi:MAG: response regulator [Chloroflexota bacterium]
MIHVLLADDHTLVREGLRALLENDGQFKVVASVANGREAVAKTLLLKPDVAVLDIAMPELNGIDAAEMIHQQCPSTRVVILSMYATGEHIHRAFRAGVLGYLLKESAGEELAAAVAAAHAGRRYMTQRIADQVLDQYLQQAARPARSPLDALSERERQVLQLVAEGRSSAEIGARLALSPRTVETYRSRVMAKLDLHDLPSLVRFAIANGLISPG